MTHQTHHHAAQHGNGSHHREKKGSKAVVATLGGLVVVAVVLAVLVYKKNGGGSYVERPQANFPASGQQSLVVPGSGDVLSAPGPNATEAERQAHGQLVASSAVETKSIDLTSCQAKPLVSRFREGAEITLINNDPVPHVMVFNPSLTFPVPAKSSSKIKANFGYGPGIYGFGCDQSPMAVGMILLTE